MTSDSHAALRRVRDRLDRSFSTHPDLELRFAFGVQTGFKGVGAVQRFDPGDPCGYNVTWELIGHWLRLKNPVKAEIRECRHFTDRDWTEGRGAGHSSFIDGVFAPVRHDAAVRLYLDELLSLDSWLHRHEAKFPAIIPPHSMIGWHGFAYLMSLADRRAFTFGFEWHTEPDCHTGYYAKPFASPGEFWRVAHLESDEPPAVLLALANKDARVCTIETIDAILSAASVNVETAPPAHATGPVSARGDRGNPASKAIGAAHALLKEGKSVSLKAACDRAGVDRKNVARRYPIEAGAIRRMGAADRRPPRAAFDRRTGNLDAVDEAED